MQADLARTLCKLLLAASFLSLALAAPTKEDFNGNVQNTMGNGELLQGNTPDPEEHGARYVQSIISQCVHSAKGISDDLLHECS